MINPNYFLLDEPKRVMTDEEDDTAPSLEAPVLKILRIDGLDESNPIPHIMVFFSYGRVNKNKKFRQMTETVFRLCIADISDDVIDGVVSGSGLNPVTRQREKSGNWFTKLASPTFKQDHRTFGNFRIEDVYLIISEMLDIKGNLKTVT